MTKFLKSTIATAAAISIMAQVQQASALRMKRNPGQEEEDGSRDVYKEILTSLKSVDPGFYEKWVHTPGAMQDEGQTLSGHEKYFLQKLANSEEEPEYDDCWEHGAGQTYSQKKTDSAYVKCRTERKNSSFNTLDALEPRESLGDWTDKKHWGFREKVVPDFAEFDSILGLRKYGHGESWLYGGQPIRISFGVARTIPGQVGFKFLYLRSHQAVKGRGFRQLVLIDTDQEANRKLSWLKELRHEHIVEWVNKDGFAFNDNLQKQWEKTTTAEHSDSTIKELYPEGRFYDDECWVSQSFNYADFRNGGAFGTWKKTRTRCQETQEYKDSKFGKLDDLLLSLDDNRPSLKQNNGGEEVIWAGGALWKNAETLNWLEYGKERGDVTGKLKMKVGVLKGGSRFILLHSSRSTKFLSKPFLQLIWLPKDDNPTVSEVKEVNRKLKELPGEATGTVELKLKEVPRKEAEVSPSNDTKNDQDQNGGTCGHLWKNHQKKVIIFGLVMLVVISSVALIG